MSNQKNVIIIALLVVGNLIGAGILALPVQTAGAGLVFSTFAMIVFCGAMFFSAVTLAGEAVEAHADNFNYPSLYQKYLGSVGKWLAVITNMLILYGLLTAYLSGGAAIIVQICGLENGESSWIWEKIVIIALFAILGAFAMRGTKIIAKYNGLLMIVLAITFTVIVVLGAINIKPERELFFNMKFLPVAIPVILTAFHFHNIIPSICRQLDWDFKAVRKSMMIGMIIGLLMNFIWVAVGIGVLPLCLGKLSILFAFEHGLPATVPIAKILKMPVFSIFAAVFALVAICTSYAANGMGLMDFNKDLFRNSLGKSNKVLIPVLTFVPPLIISIFFPNVFLMAIGVVGGVGIAVLFGILPSIVFFIKHKSLRMRALALLMLVLFLAALCADLAKDFGFVKTKEIIWELKHEAAKDGTD